MKSPLEVNNKLNNKYIKVNNTYKNESTTTEHYIKGSAGACLECSRKAKGNFAFSQRKKAPRVHHRNNRSFPYPRYSPASSFLALHPLSILTLLALSLCSSVCFAQKYTYGKSHNPLLQQTQNVVIPHIKYGQGLNRWSFLSVDRDNHGLHSDLLCPNPMMTSSSLSGYGRGGSGGVTARVNPGRGKQQPPPYQQQQYPQSRFPGGQVGAAGSRSSSSQPLPNEIWALKTDEQASLLPCSLRQFAVPPQFSGNSGGMVIMNGGGGRGGGGRHNNNNNNGHFSENRILFINVSLVPFNFHGAIPCSKYIKLMYDEEEGTNLRCGDISFDPRHDYDNKYHINWPPSRAKRKDYFSLLDNLERFLQNEQTLHRQFYFQIYFTSQINGRSKRCTVQQYELDLSYPAGNARFCNLSTTHSGGGHEELCGEFHCDDLIFPLYLDPPTHSAHDAQSHGHHNKGKHHDHEDYNGEDDNYSEEYDDTSQEEGQNLAKGGGGGGSTLGQTHEERSNQHQNDQANKHTSWLTYIRKDMRLLIFFTVVPLVLFGVLVFGMELIVYFMCCRKRRDEDDEGGGTRSQQLLENSLNVWENVPSRMDAQRTVSFSPMTTSIYGDRKNHHLATMDAASLDSHPETPKILKSALKSTKSDHGSPTTAAHHYFDYHDHDMPPSYIETTTR